MIKYLQLPFSFDPAALQRDTLQIGEEYWKLHFQVKHYSGEWSAIPLRSIGGAADNGFIQADTLYFNNLVQTKKELEQSWIIPVKDSWLAKRVSFAQELL